jgi:hypothetical protein
MSRASSCCPRSVAEMANGDSFETEMAAHVCPLACMVTAVHGDRQPTTGDLFCDVDFNMIL